MLPENKSENHFYGKKMSKKVIGRPFFIINCLNHGNLLSHDFNIQWTETQFLIQQILNWQAMGNDRWILVMSNQGVPQCVNFITYMRKKLENLLVCSLACLFFKFQCILCTAKLDSKNSKVN